MSEAQKQFEHAWKAHFAEKADMIVEFIKKELLQ